MWGSLLCTATMDKLGKIMYENETHTYKYKGIVDTPCLGMVDDILSIQECSDDTVKANALVNSFIESKKFTLSNSKCHRIHINKGKKIKPISVLSLEFLENQNA